MDVTKLVKIRIRRMRILTFKIRRMRMQMRMQMRIVAFVLQVRSWNVVHWFRSIK